MPFGFNKYYALIVALIILIICYFVFARRKSTSLGKRKKGKKIRDKGRRGKSAKGRVGSDKAKVSADDDDGDDDGDDGGNEQTALEQDAEELYNLVHDSLINGMELDDFQETVGDLANSFIYIELKQLYNSCLQRKMNPAETVTVEDYVKILEKEANST